VTTRPGTLNMREAVYYAWSQPVSTVIIGIDSLEQLEENVALAREFTPLSEQQIAALHEKTAPVAEQALWFRRFSRG
jgi:aryl-alcohol dehydrogenase-like predicted oxidoreductase